MGQQARREARIGRRRTSLGLGFEEAVSFQVRALYSPLRTVCTFAVCCVSLRGSEGGGILTGRMTNEDLVMREPSSAVMWSSGELGQAHVAMRLPYFVLMIFTSRRHIGIHCPSFFLLPSNRLRTWVRITATYDTSDGLLWSILGSSAHIVTTEALWWYLAVPKMLQLWLGAMQTHLHLTMMRSSAQPETRNRRSAWESTTHVCSLLFTRERYK